MEIANRLESNMRSFLWPGIGHRETDHLVSWVVSL